MVRQRRQKTATSTSAPASSVPAQVAPAHKKTALPTPREMGSTAERRPLLDSSDNNDNSNIDIDIDDHDGAMALGTWVRRNQWIVFALASGACAAFNGVFAKLTTTDLTSSFSKGVASFLHLSNAENVIEFIVRAIFFGLNLVFNGIMWSLFTTALTRGHSTTQVSIINTSSNFVITAILGLAIFSEALPPLWWVGATLLVAGNVIIGAKDEGPKDPESEESVAIRSGGAGSYQPIPQIDPEDKDDEDVVDLGDLEELEVRREES